jgi:thymidylate synthase (FAD)
MSTADEDGRKTRRLVSPRAEEFLGRKIPCLDRGFIYLVDYFGGDDAIVQAARVSYGLGTKTLHEDRGLIRYLMRHQHTTPFEMVELKFHVKLPIFVARQWIRHRTACLTGDVHLVFDLPGGERRGKRHHYRMTIAKFFSLWHEGTRHPIPKKKPLFLERVDPNTEYTVPELSRLVERRQEDLRNLIRAGTLRARRLEPTDPRAPVLRVRGADWHEYATKPQLVRVSMRDRLARMRLRMCDESSGEIRHTTVADVWQSGVKPVFRVALENGFSITMSKDHRCLTERGWMTLQQATGLRLREGGGVTWDGGAPAFAVNGVPAYQDPAWLAARRAEGLDVAKIAMKAGTSYHTIRKYLTRYGLQYTSKEKSRLSGMVQRGQKRAFKTRRVFAPAHLRVIREARGGASSNFWKGGITLERANIGRWTKEQAPRVHAKYGYRCVVCGGSETLHAHHVDPVWHNAARARDPENLVTLCTPCHGVLHHRNLELPFLAAFVAQEPLHDFFARHVGAKRPAGKRLPRVRRLVRTFSKIRRIEFAGHEMTYDLAVTGPFHNFVANGFIVHNSVNEYSGRYSVMPDEFYVPDAEQVTAQSKGNRQGGGDRIDAARAADVVALLRREQELVREGYQKMLDWDVRRELARINLGVAQYTEWYWKNDLHNVFHFLKLRLDEHAQYEIRVYAEAMAQIVQAVAPVAWEAFEDYQLKAERLSRLEMETLARLLDGAREAWPSDEDVLNALPRVWTERNADGSLKRNRERDEFLTKLNRLRELGRRL